MENVAIEVPSESGDVHTSWTASSGFIVKLADDIADRHDTETIGAEVEETWHLAIRNIHDEANAFRQEQKGRGSEEKNHLDDTSIERPTRVAAVEEQIQVEARSPRKYVSVAWDSHDDVIVAINSEALKKLSSNSLEREINQAIAAVHKDYQRKLIEIHEKTFLRK